jgi:hypothetical protein
MDQPTSVPLADCRRERDSNAQELRHIHRAAEQPIERLAARVFEHQRQATIASGKGQRPRRPVKVEVSPQCVFMLEALE